MYGFFLFLKLLCKLGHHYRISMNSSELYNFDLVREDCNGNQNGAQIEVSSYKLMIELLLKSIFIC